LLIACKEYESEFIQQVRQGNTHLLSFRERLLHLDTQKNVSDY